MKKIIFIFIICINYIFYADTIENMNSRIKVINSKIKKSKIKVTGLKKEEKNIIKKIKKIDLELKKVKREYYEVESKYVGLNRKIDYSHINIKFMEKEIWSKNENIKKYITSWYKYGGKLKLEYILSGNTIYDVINREGNLKKILNFNKKYISNVMEKQQKVKIQKSKIEMERNEVSKLKKDLRAKKNEISKKQYEKKKLINSLKNKENYYNSLVKDLRNEKKQIEKEISDIIKSKTDMKKNKNLKYIKNKIKELKYPINGKILVRYGEYKNIGNGNKIKSSRIEIKGKIGDRVKASGKGRVIFSGKLEHMGTVIIVDHGYGLTTMYANLIASYVHEGSIVISGEKIGVLGLSETGEAVLYFETRLGVSMINPMIFLKK
ncbi:murein hydrolase activator EnvC family protein [Haliovirga abyssi]|uniref:Peptidase M23 n=1 Tax=Haliovirga abyssi TaxID=2996794 RepID=A0AAU9D671_9FUSO|nr:peptidoglycan DD-metalloendopeptidase family protein [Haliovirga abyssi]BDU50043.1 peptidase M23 [Haliovirga abyssi]